MNVTSRNISINQLVNGYKDNGDNGVVGYAGKLNIRPPYQREFIYNEEQENAVIDSVMNGFPLNSIFWSCDDSNVDEYEVLDGQQRILSICRYYDAKLAYNDMFYHGLSTTEKRTFNSYKLNIYVCTGDNKEKLKWFERINIAGEKLNEQELLNALYTGPWLTEAKKLFSKTQCVAYRLGNRYLSGVPIRQDYLKTVLKWISKNKIQDYMSTHHYYPNANDLWDYFQSVINWIDTTFPEYRKKEMLGLNWGTMYDDYHKITLDSKILEDQIKILMMDDDVTNKKGIYQYVLSNWVGKPDESYLNIRQFTDSQKRSTYEKQNGKCAECKESIDISMMEADHIKPWIEGGKTSIDNCQMLCKEHNRRKGAK